MTAGDASRPVVPARLVAGVLLTTVGALSVHVGMLQGLGVPFPGDPIHAPFAQSVSRGFLHVLGLLWLDALIAPRLAHRSFPVRAGVLFLLSATLTEALFRLPFMQGYCADSLAYAFIDALPRQLASLVLAVLVVAAGPTLSTLPRRLAGAAVLGAVSTQLLLPVFAAAFAGPLAALASLSHPNWCELPYGLNVEVPAYLSFLEPVLAAFAIAALAWDRLPAGPVRRLLAFALLVMLIRRQVLAAPIYMAYSPMPPWTGLAAMGQFTLEAVALGLLTGVCWRWARASGA